MAKNRKWEGVANRVYEVAIGAPLALLIGYLAKEVGKMETQQAIIVGGLAFASAVGFILFLRRESEKQRQVKPTRLDDAREIILRQAQRAPVMFPSASRIANWRAETEIVIENIVNTVRAKDKFTAFFPAKNKPSKSDISKAVAFLESLASGLHEDDLRKYPDRF